MPVIFRSAVRKWVSASPEAPPIFRRVGGRELDGFNGKVVNYLIPHSRPDTKDRLQGIAQVRKREIPLMPPSSLPFTKSHGFKTKDMKFDTEAFVRHFIKTELGRCTTSNVADLMRSSAKETKKSASPSLLKEHMTSIAEKLRSFTATDWKFKDIAAIFYGLQSFEESDEGVMEIVSILADAVGDSVDRNLPQRSQDISMILLGLQNLSTGNPITRKLLSRITKMILVCTENFDEQNVGNALLGLQSMSSECAEVRNFLSALTGRIKGDNFKLSSQAVGNAVRGLRQMSSSCPEVRKLLSALTVKIDECTAELNVQAVCDSLSGLRGMSFDHEEERTLLFALNIKYQASKRRFSSQEMGYALQSLQNFGSDITEIRDLLSVLLLKLNRLTDDHKISSVCQSLQGMQGMNAECEEVQGIMVVLVEKFMRMEEQLTAQDISYVLYGLRVLRDSLDDTQYQKASNFVLLEAKRITYGMNSSSVTPLLQSVSLDELKEFQGSVTSNLPKLQELFEAKDFKSWRVISLLLKERVDAKEKLIEMKEKEKQRAKEEESEKIVMTTSTLLS